MFPLHQTVQLLDRLCLCSNRPYFVGTCDPHTTCQSFGGGPGLPNQVAPALIQIPRLVLVIRPIQWSSDLSSACSAKCKADYIPYMYKTQGHVLYTEIGTISLCLSMYEYRDKVQHIKVKHTHLNEHKHTHNKRGREVTE